MYYKNSFFNVCTRRAEESGIKLPNTPPMKPSVVKVVPVVCESAPLLKTQTLYTGALTLLFVPTLLPHSNRVLQHVLLSIF